MNGPLQVKLVGKAILEGSHNSLGAARNPLWLRLGHPILFTSRSLLSMPIIEGSTVRSGTIAGSILSVRSLTFAGSILSVRSLTFALLDLLTLLLTSRTLAGSCGTT